MELIKAEEKISTGIEEGDEVDKAEAKFDQAMNAFDRYDNEEESTANSEAIENPKVRAQ